MRAFLFTGQGNEYESMAKELYNNNSLARNIIDELKISFDFKDIFINKSNFIHDTRYSQIGNFVISSILARLLNNRGIFADVTAGLSLGEYTALWYSGAISYKDVISILDYRSSIMYDTLKDKNTGMIAIMFLNYKIVEKICSKFNSCYISNYNSENQVVIAGDLNDIEECARLCVKSGAKKVVKLNVIGAFHTNYLKQASIELEKFISNYNFINTSIPVYYNYLGNKSKDDIKNLIVKQLYNPVLFRDIIINMLNDGVNEFYVIGIGRTIDNIVRTIAINNKKKVKIVHIEKLKDIEVKYE